MPDSPEPILIAADAVVSMDAALPKVLLNAAVAVEGQRIRAVGDLAEIRAAFPKAPLEQHPGTLLPGFINAHTHLELSYHKAAALSHESFPGWVSKLIAGYPAADQLDAVVRKAVRDGAAESLRAGVTTVGDISRHCAAVRDELLRMADRPRVVSFGEVVALGKMRDKLQPRLDAALERPAAQGAQDQLVIGVSPHAPYTVEGPVLRKIVSRAIARSAPITMHLAELKEETDFLRDLSGPLGREWDLMIKMDVLDDQIPPFPTHGGHSGGPIRWAQRWGLIVTDKRHMAPPPRQLPVILAHANYIDDAELAQLAASAVSIAYCPRTHAYFAHPPHRYRDMLSHGMNVCLGTDSRASNPDLSILKEAQLLAQRDQLDPHTALEMITINGANALGMRRLVGSLSPTKYADMVLIPTTARDDEAILKEIVTSAAAPEMVWLSGRKIPRSAL